MNHFNLYNSLSKKKEIFEPITPGTVKMYVCGPTVYDLLHVGNFRGLIFFNVLRNWLKHLGYSVNYVYNYTDIDDKIIEKSNEKNISYRELGENVWKEFDLAHENLNCLVPDMEPRATAYIPEIIQYIEKLIQNGFGYVTSSGVYYDVSKFKNYLE